MCTIVDLLAEVVTKGCEPNEAGLRPCFDQHLAMSMFPFYVSILPTVLHFSLFHPFMHLTFFWTNQSKARKLWSVETWLQFKSFLQIEGNKNGQVQLI